MIKQVESRQVTEKVRVSDWERKIISLREQGELKNRWLDYRINHVLPEIMNRENLDMWIIIAREYNEDPVIMSFLPSTMITARRRTILVFFKKKDDTIERLCLSRPGTGLDHIYKGVWTNPIPREVIGINLKKSCPGISARNKKRQILRKPNGNV